MAQQDYPLTFTAQYSDGASELADVEREVQRLWDEISAQDEVQE